MKLSEILIMIGKNPFVPVTRETWDSRILNFNLDESPVLFLDEHGQEYEITQEDYYADDWIVLASLHKPYTDFHKFQRLN